MSRIRDQVLASAANIQKELEPLVEDYAERLLDGAKDDIKQYAADITRDATLALALAPDRREAMLGEIKAQVKLLGERNRIRANDGSWELFEKTIEVIFRSLVVAIVGLGS